MFISALSKINLKFLFFLVSLIFILIHQIFNILTRKKEKDFFRTIFGNLIDTKKIPVSKELFFYNWSSWNSFKTRLIETSKEFESNPKYNLFYNNNYARFINLRLGQLISNKYIEKPSHFPVSGYFILEEENWEKYLDNYYKPKTRLLVRSLSSYNTNGLGFFNFFRIIFGFISYLLELSNWIHPVRVIYMYLYYTQKEFEQNLNVNLASCIVTAGFVLQFIGLIVGWILDQLIFD